VKNNNVRLERLGKILDIAMIPKNDWSFEFTQAPYAISMGQIHRIFFSTRSKKDNNGNYISYLSFIDYDFEKREIIKFAPRPIIKLGEDGTFDEHGTYPFSILSEGSRYLGYYAGWSRKVSVPYDVKIGMVTSFNCEEFSKVGVGPVLGASLHEPMTISGPRIFKFNDRFHLFYLAGEKWEKDENGRPESIFKIRHAESHDGISWERQNSMILKPILEDDECQASPTVFRHDGVFHMFFSYKYGSNFRGTNRGYRLGYAVSSDLLNWQRRDEQLSISESIDVWDNFDISYPSAFQIHGSWYLLYQGNEIGKAGFGYAKISFSQNMEQHD
jgi:predicted GH43/DUF377 family glycosyl hydrolase